MMTNRTVRRILGWTLGGLLLLAATATAQGPYSAQIQAALRAFLINAHTWTGTQTFTDITLNGSCSGCPTGMGDAPSDATYITQTGSAGLSAEQALADLATGILKSTTTTGVLSIAAGSDIVALFPLTLATTSITFQNTDTDPLFGVDANGNPYLVGRNADDGTPFTLGWASGDPAVTGARNGDAINFGVHNDYDDSDSSAFLEVSTVAGNAFHRIGSDAALTVSYGIVAATGKFVFVNNPDLDVTDLVYTIDPEAKTLVVEGGIGVTALAGTGVQYACLDANGALVRSAAACGS